MVNNFSTPFSLRFLLVTFKCVHVSPQWRDADEAEDVDVAEDGDEGEVDQGDDSLVFQFILITSLFVQDGFFFFFFLSFRGNDL